MRALCEWFKTICKILSYGSTKLHKPTHSLTFSQTPHDWSHYYRRHMLNLGDFKTQEILGEIPKIHLHHKACQTVVWEFLGVLAILCKFYS